MQINYALYDPSYNTANGNYWTWYDAGMLPLEMLQMFYRDVLVKHLPGGVFDLANTHFWDNFVPVTVHYRDWTVIYRFFSGGKDKFGRPGRYIILTAWVKTVEAEDVDLSPHVNDVFCFVAKNAATLPVPRPKKLSEKLDIEPPKPETENTGAYELLTSSSESLSSISILEDKPQQTATSSPQRSNRGKSTWIGFWGVVMLSFLLGMGTGVGAGIVLQYFYPILPLTFKIAKHDTNETRTDP
jgi:hypothetical protein